MAPSPEIFSRYAGVPRALLSVPIDARNFEVSDDGKRFPAAVPLESAKGADARRRAAEKLLCSSGDAPDTAPVLREFLQNAPHGYKVLLNWIAGLKQWV